MRTRSTAVGFILGGLVASAAFIAPVAAQTAPPAGDAEASRPRPGEIVVEAHEAGFNHTMFKELSGVWVTSNSKSRADSLSSTAASRKLTAVDGKLVGSAEFRPDIPAAGTYEVEITWPRNSNAKDVTIRFDGLPDAKPFLFSFSPADAPGTRANRWVSLGQFELPAGRAFAVVVDPSTSTGPVLADQPYELVLDGIRLRPPARSGGGGSSPSGDALPLNPFASGATVGGQTAPPPAATPRAAADDNPFAAPAPATTPAPAAPRPTPPPRRSIDEGSNAAPAGPTPVPGNPFDSASAPPSVPRATQNDNPFAAPPAATPAGAAARTPAAAPSDNPFAAPPAPAGGAAATPAPGAPVIDAGPSTPPVPTPVPDVQPANPFGGGAVVIPATTPAATPAATVAATPAAAAEERVRAPQNPAGRQASRLEFSSSVADALARAKKENRVAVVIFASDSIAYRRFEENVLANGDVMAALQATVPTIVDIRQKPEDAARFAVRRAPYVVVIDQNGFTKAHIWELKDAAAFRQAVVTAAQASF